MDNLDDLKAVWLSAKTDVLPTSDELLKLVKKFRRQKLMNKYKIIAGAILSAALMLLVMFVYKSTLLSTRFGEVLIIAACVLLAATNIRSVKRFYHLQDCSNKEFLQFIEKTRQNQLYYYKKTQVLFLLLWSVGFISYLYELVYKHTALFVCIYIVAVGYILAVWFVIRPRSFRKNAAKLNETKQRLEKISDQLK